MTRLIYARRPFGEEVIPRFVPEGQTLSEMIADLDDLPPTWRDDFMVTVDGRPVPAEIWDRARPKPGRTVTVSLALGGGKALKLFAQIAILAAAAAVSFLPGGQFIAAGVLLAGQLAINKLFAPPQQAIAQDNRGDGPGQASISTNVLAKGRRLPRVCGTRRIFPPSVTYTLTELVGETEVVEGVLALAGPHEATDVRVGETLAAELTDFDYEIREGRRGDQPLSLVRRYGREESVGIVMSEHRFDRDAPTQLEDQSDPLSSLPGWHRVTMVGAGDEAWLTFLWPEGLFDDDDPTAERGMAIRLRFRLLGTTTWHHAPELHVRWKRAQAFKLAVKLMWQAMPVLVAAPQTGGFTHAFVEVPAHGGPVSAAGAGWQAHAHFDAGAGLTNATNVNLFSDKAELYLDEGTFPKGRYEIEAIHSLPIRTNNFTVSTYAYNGTVRDLFGYFVSGGAVVPYSLAGEHQKVQLVRCATVVNADPAPRPGDFKLAFKGRNRSFDAVSLTASGLVPVWDPVAEEWSGLEASTDPAAHFRHALTGALTAQPVLPADLVDEAALAGWRAHCANEGLTVNAIIEEQSLWDVLTVLAVAGNAEPRASEKWGVIWERDRSADPIRQLFTPRNSRGAVFRKATETRPDAIIATFPEASNAYSDRQITVYDDGINATTPDVRFEERRYDWLGVEADVIARVRLELRMERLRDTLFEREVAYDGRFLQRGDLVGVQDEVWDVDTGSALIKEIVTDGLGNITGLVLDAKVRVLAEPLLKDVADVTLVDNVRLLGLSGNLGIRLLDGTMLSKALSGPTAETATVTFSTPFAMPTADFGGGAEDNLAPGCLVVAGVVEYRRLLISGITSRSASTMRLSFLDEAPGIHA